MLFRKMIKFKGSKNCDINYLIKIFDRENNIIMNGAMEMINRKQMFIKRNTGIQKEKRNLDILIDKNNFIISKRNNFLKEIDLKKKSNHINNLLDNTYDDNNKINLKDKDVIDKLNLNSIILII